MKLFQKGQYAPGFYSSLCITILSVFFGSPAEGQSASIYVSNYGLNNIEEFNSLGQGRVIASGTSGSAFVSSPGGLAFDSEGDLFEVNETGVPPEILKIGPQGNISVFANLANDYSIGLAIDAENNVYVANSHSGTVEKFNPNGSGSLFASGLGFATGLAFDSSGNLYVADASANTIFKINPQGNVTTFAAGGLLSSPYGLTFNTQGDLFVGNGTSILEFNSSGQATVFATGLSYAQGLAFDSEGNLYVANFGYSNYGDIEVFDSQGNGSVFTTDVSQPTFLAIQEVPEPCSLACSILGIGLFSFRKYFTWRFRS